MEPSALNAANSVADGMAHEATIGCPKAWRGSTTIPFAGDHRVGSSPSKSIPSRRENILDSVLLFHQVKQVAILLLVSDLQKDCLAISHEFARSKRMRKVHYFCCSLRSDSDLSETESVPSESHHQTQFHQVQKAEGRLPLDRLIVRDYYRRALPQFP